MNSPLHGLGRPALEALAGALRSGHLRPRYGKSKLAGRVPPEMVGALAGELRAMHEEGMEPHHIARCLELVAAERRATQAATDRISLVWSPPELDQVDSRDTAVVVQDLFAQAQRSVLIVSYAIDDGSKAAALFGNLAGRMDANPALAVRIVANVKRPYQDLTPSALLVKAFTQRFREKLWPGTRLPDVFHFPRSLETEGHKRASLHAKWIVVDGRWSLLTSANFTEAAQHRNIEAGLWVDDERLAARLTRQVDRLVEGAVLQPLWPIAAPGPSPVEPGGH